MIPPTLKLVLGGLVVIAACHHCRAAYAQNQILVFPVPLAAAPVEEPAAVDPDDAAPLPAVEAPAPVAVPAPAIRLRAGGIRIRMAAPAAEAEVDDVRLAAIRVQFQPLLSTELSFANRVCEWTDAERVAAIKAGRAWLADFAQDYAKNNGGGNRGMMIMAGNMVMPRGDAQLDPEQRLSEALERGMTDQHRTAYQAERDKRDAFRTDAIIDNIVAKMDQMLELTPEQRRSIGDSLRDKWSDEWAPALELFVQMSEYAPAFPDEIVVPFLTPPQFEQWQRVQRISARRVNFGGGVFGNNVQPINDIDLNEGK